jgi:hypothetical protein
MFWRENQLVQTKKQCKKESSSFGEPRIRLGTNQGTSFQDLELIIDLCLVPSKYIELHKFESQKSFTLVEAIILNKYKRK